MSESGLPVVTPKRLMTGPWVTPTPEVEPTLGDLVDVCRLVRQGDRVLEVDGLHRRPEMQRLGGVGDAEAEAHRVAHAGTVNTRKSSPFDLGGEFDGCLTAAGYGGEGQGRHSIGHGDMFTQNRR